VFFFKIIDRPSEGSAFEICPGSAENRVILDKKEPRPIFREVSEPIHKKPGAALFMRF